ncbi:hypothetical protein [Acinetobacter sp. P8-3-8]|uniref:hypothetical protein n=1 Tax=Acinetobacter sp. P8-3-8 TaxID=1029823 RepID=UPI0002D9F128|nr:hypothetical protein [Acinetobacter sp. P8-3-8]
MNNDQSPKKPQKYADSSISDKDFKRMIVWFSIFCGFFMIGVIVSIGADSANMLLVP